MTRLLDLMARVAVRTPKLTLVSLLLLTAGFAAAATTLEVDTGLDAFAPAEGPAATMQAIEDRFGTSESVQVLVDAGPGGTVLDHTGLAAAADLEEALTGDPAVAAALAPDRTGRPAVVTYGLPFLAGVEASGAELDELDPASLELLVAGVLDGARDQVEPLLADDLEADPARARSGLVSVDLDTSAPDEVRREASRAVEEVVARTDTGALRTSVLSVTAIEDGIEHALERDLPVLLGTSLLLVLLVLLWLFRSASDVLLGFVGLLASVVWMGGIAALLGPRWLGLTGEANQITIAVPVLLVGLGIDYSVHLTSRYREQRARGDAPDRSARLALATVGLALVLATVASVAGFLANVVTPLPPIRDFGIFAAAGIVSAFVILGGAVPATRVLLDRRRAARAVTGRAAERVTGPPPRWARLTAGLASRHAGIVLVVTAAVLVAGTIAASGLDTEFDERDFLPEDGPVTAVIDRLDAQFGGNVGERTYVLVDGDPSDPALVAAVAALEDALPAVDGVRTVGDRADVSSALTLVDQMAAAGVAVRARLAADLDTWHDPAAAAARLELPDAIDPAMLERAGAEPDLPDELRAALEARLPADHPVLGALVGLADPVEIEREIRAALADELAAERPDALGDEALARLAARPEDALTLAALTAEGFPLDRLSEDDRADLETLEALEAAGWAPDRASSGDGASLRAQLEVVRERDPEELARLADGDGLLLVVSTAAGSDVAEELAADIEAAAAPATAAGGRVTVVSSPLVQADIIASLSAAQLAAILISLVAAAVLLVTATVASSRSVVLGLIGIVPSTVALVLVLGSMRLIGLSFNALTATVASISVGIGVPYGIHLINRFREARNHGLHADEAILDTLRNTGAALAGSATTTGLAFAVLMLSELIPIQQFGTVSTLMIVYALLACLLVQPALLVLWARRRDVLGAPPRRRGARRAARARRGSGQESSAAYSSSITSA